MTRMPVLQIKTGVGVGGQGDRERVGRGQRGMEGGREGWRRRGGATDARTSAAGEAGDEGRRGTGGGRDWDREGEIRNRQGGAGTDREGSAGGGGVARGGCQLMRVPVLQVRGAGGGRVTMRAET